MNLMVVNLMYRRSLVAALLLLVILAACTTRNDKFNSTELASAEIGLEGGTLTADTPDGTVELNVPANALSTPSRVSISRVQDSLSFPSGLEQLGDAYLFSQVCLRVEEGATVTASLPIPAPLPPGVGNDDLVLVSFPDRDTTGREITATVSGSRIQGDISALCEALVIGVPSERGGGGDVITFFRSNPSTLLRGDPSTLSWDVDVPPSGSFDITITPGIGTVARTDTTTVSPNVTTSYTLEVSGGGVSANSELVVEVPAAVGNISPDVLDLTATAGTNGSRTDTGIVSFSNVGGTDTTLDYTIRSVGTQPSEISIVSGGSGTVAAGATQEVEFELTCTNTPVDSSAVFIIDGTDTPFDGEIRVDYVCLEPPGMLGLTVTGLPSGASTTVDIIGGSTTQTITFNDFGPNGTQTQTVMLRPGNYDLDPQDSATFQGTTYNARQSGVQVTVISEQMSQVTVEYAQ